jgi:hypothetical protein
MSFRIRDDINSNPIKNVISDVLKNIVVPMKLVIGGSLIAFDDYIISGVEYTFSTAPTNSYFSIFIDNILKKTVNINFNANNNNRTISLISLNIPIKKGSLLQIKSNDGTSINIDFIVYLSKSANSNDFTYEKQILNSIMDQSSILLQLSTVFD